MPKPKSHRCKHCEGQLIPIEIWQDHQLVHSRQIDMFPETVTAPTAQKRPRVRRRPSSSITFS